MKHTLQIFSAATGLSINFEKKKNTFPPPPWIDWLRMQYGWNDTRDFGDDIPHVTPVWKDIYAQLPSFRDDG